MKILITSGGTKIKIDLVRSITNMSKGNFGSKIAQVFLEREYPTTFLYAKDSKTPFLTSYNIPNFNPITYVTFDDYKTALELELEKKPDIVVLAAAVSDYGVENPIDGKIRSGDDLVIRLKPLPKLISMVRQKCPECTLCGFKLLVNSTDEELRNAIVSSIHKNGCDLVVGNDLRDIRAGKHKLIIGVNTYEVDSENNPLVTFHEYTSDIFNLPEVVVNYCLNKKGKNE